MWRQIKNQTVNSPLFGLDYQCGRLLASTHIVVGTGRAVIEGLACGNAAVILGKTYQGILTRKKLPGKEKLM